MHCSLNDNLISSIQAIGKKHFIEKIVVFGSRARGDNKPTSDIDLAIFALPEFTNKGYLSSEIDDLNTLLKIDLIFINKNTEPKLLRNIEKEGVCIYEKSYTEI